MKLNDPESLVLTVITIPMCISVPELQAFPV